ncbi:uncharacterized protein TNCV_821711 [Trichonephila clavipes]|nr:uncharacterized protein TNCV_821711 [Trichonephila clavipes]
MDEADISIPVAVDQRATKCLDEAIRSFTVMRSMCRSSRVYVDFGRPLPVFRVVRCSSVHCFETGMAVEWLHCTRAPKARLGNPLS